jgi:hypothetical protein
MAGSVAARGIGGPGGVRCAVDPVAGETGTQMSQALQPLVGQLGLEADNRTSAAAPPPHWPCWAWTMQRPGARRASFS